MIKAETTYTEKHVSAIMRHYRSQKSNKERLSELITRTVFMSVIMALLIWQTVTGSLVYLPILICWTIYFAVMTFLDLKPFFEKPPGNCINRKRTFVFEEDYFGMRSEENGYNAERFARYDSLHSACEWDEWFFVNFNKTETCCINKSDLAEGTSEELRELLKGRLGDRFHVEQHEVNS